MDLAATWDHTPVDRRRSIVWGLWLATWIGLLAGLVDPLLYHAVVVFSVAHALLFLALHGFRVAEFPVQVRLTYVLWVAIGTYVPGMRFLLWIATIGLVGNLFFGYCPLARMMYLLPWNRDEPLSWDLVARVVTTPPVAGRFRPAPRA
jgi:hypothetical protein